jgi:cobalamin biosynthesis Mg chelatase CobN
MKHFILVLTIILFVLLTFLYPSIIEDASFNDYTYLRNLRRSDNSIDNEYTKKKLHENTIFNTASGSTGTSSTGSSAGSSAAASVGFAPILYNTTPTVKKDQTVYSETETKSESSTNLLPYLLLLLILVIVIIVYIKYKTN